MKSLARLVRWCFEMNENIQSTARKRKKCLHKILENPPRPVKPGNAYMLITAVHFSITPNAEFKTKEPCKIFSRGGVHIALVTEIGTHFVAQEVKN